MSNSAGVSRKEEDAYPTGVPDSCSQFLVEYELFICFCYFVCIILVTLYVIVSLSCVCLFSGLCPWTTIAFFSFSGSD